MSAVPLNKDAIPVEEPAPSKVIIKSGYNVLISSIHNWETGKIVFDPFMTKVSEKANAIILNINPTISNFSSLFLLQ